MSIAEEHDRLLRRLRAAHRVAGLGSWERQLGDEHRRVDWSPEVYEIAGWPTDRELTYDDFVSLVHPDDRPAFFEARDEALAGRRPYRMDLRLVRPDGGVRHVNIDAEIVRDDEGRAHRLIGVVQDRTEEIESLRRLRVTEVSRRQLLERVLDAADRERDRLARRLATGPIEQLRAVEATMAAAIDEDVDPRYAEALDSVQRSIASLVGTLSAITEEPALSDLATVVADLASDASADLVVTCDVRVSGALRPAVRSVVVRLVQEALQNIRKHADADRASVEVAATNGSVRVAVRDDGRGFDPHAVATGRGHFGLASLRDDVAAVGGRLTLSSEPGRTLLEADLPAG